MRTGHTGRQALADAYLDVRVGGEVDGAEGHVAQQAGARALVQAEQAELAHHGQRAHLAAARDLARYLQPDLHDLQRVREYHLRAARLSVTVLH